MDLKGSLIDTNLKIYLNEESIKFLKTLPVSDDIPHNILEIINDVDKPNLKTYKNDSAVHISAKDIQNLNKIKIVVRSVKVDPMKTDEVTEENDYNDESKTQNRGVKKGHDDPNNDSKTQDVENKGVPKELDNPNENKTQDEENESSDYDGKPYLVTADLDWLYNYMKTKRDNGDKIPYLHELLEGVHIEMPKNEVLKRNPVLEARCVKLRAQQEAREYRKMTKSVDNVRMRFPEDSISYQLKQVNRQLIAIGQFIISIFAGFLFGFRGVEWMVGNLDFGFRLLLGVMCALVIALAEIYFLAKKLNEELCIPETVQLGGPPKFADERDNKQHQD